MVKIGAELPKLSQKLKLSIRFWTTLYKQLRICRRTQDWTRKEVHRGGSKNLQKMGWYQNTGAEVPTLQRRSVAKQQQSAWGTEAEQHSFIGAQLFTFSS